MLIYEKTSRKEITMNDFEETKPSVIKKLFKTVCIAIMLAVYIILAIRIFVSCDSEIVNKVLKTPGIEAAYAEKGSDFIIEQYEITNWYKSKNPAGMEQSDRGGKLLSVDSLYYIPDTENLQITVKFNLDILKDRETVYSSDTLPFEIYLEDENLDIYRNISAVEYDERYSFGYIRLCFDGIKLEKNDGTTDADGDPSRKSYEMYLEMRNADGEYEPYESFSIYTGKKYSKRIEYK
jgi:hypothetical protein